MEMFSTEVFSGSWVRSGSWRTVLNFKEHNQRGGGKWHMYHTDETRFYQTDDSKVTRRLLKEKSKLTFVDVQIMIFIACLLKGSQEQSFFLQTLSFTAFLATVKNENIRTCGHMILGQLRMGARQTNYAPLIKNIKNIKKTNNI